MAPEYSTKQVNITRKAKNYQVLSNQIIQKDVREKHET